MINRQNVISFFNSYVAAYNATDPKIKLKIDHTFRVASLCETISATAGREKDFAYLNSNLARDRAEQSWQQLPAASRGLDSVRGIDPSFAWLTGMLHDIGRFEQIRRYNTFSDAASVDHAKLGADLLFHEGLLARIDITLTPHEQHLLETAIRCHSAYRLPPGLTGEEVAYCNILRDADKIDIFRVNCDTPLEDIYNVTTAELLASPVSEAVKQCFLNRTAVLRSLKQHPADFIVGHICLLFELVYPVSLAIAKQQGYADRLLNFRSSNPETESWFAFMRTHTWPSCAS